MEPEERDYIRLRQKYAEDILALGEGSRVFGHLERYGDKALDDVIEVLNSDYVSNVGSDGLRQGNIYGFMEDIEMLSSVSAKYYKIEVDENHIEAFRDQIDEMADSQWGAYELIAYLKQFDKNRKEDGSDKSLVSYMREQEKKTPSRDPLVRNFGSITDALRIAGLDTKDELGPEMHADRLRKAVYEKNKGSDYIIDTLTSREIDNSDFTHREKTYRDVFGSIEKAYEAAGLGAIRRLENDLGSSDFGPE